MPAVPKKIHLLSLKTNTSFCGNLAKSDIITCERPPDREMARLCAECRRLYNKNLADEYQKRQEAWNNRPPRQKLHDWLSGLASLGDSDMDLLLYPFTILMTLGLVIPGKHIAKLLLKAGV
jgi:hypothetical protein